MSETDTPVDTTTPGTDGVPASTELYDLRQAKNGSDAAGPMTLSGLAAREGERTRAYSEQREPDYSDENLEKNATVGTVLVEKRDLPTATAQSHVDSALQIPEPKPAITIDGPVNYPAPGGVNDGEVDLTSAAQAAREKLQNAELVAAASADQPTSDDSASTDEDESNKDESPTYEV